MAGGMAENKSWVANLIRAKSLPVHRTPKMQFLKQFSGKRTQGIVVAFTGKIIKDLPSFGKNRRNICLLAMDNVEDPQNLGQIIRTSECAGIEGIILPRHGSVHITDTVLQVSQGAFLHTNIYIANNIAQLISEMKNGYLIIKVYISFMI